ncbi:MAG TPA: zf-TFIIB domain-containing protein [Candidatus Thermoplasmatota archaeon]|nr:zf-TFIIB domain-containing protein [Candidatus Thermoplasmatota archaeon]
MERACPRDGTKLVEEKHKDVTVDACPKCQGIFLDKNELKKLSGDADLNKYLRDMVGYDVDSQLLCPSCGGLMDAEHVRGVEVEVCLTCFGLWLDHGELDALVAAKGNAVALTPEKEAEIKKAQEADHDRARRRRGILARGPLGALDRGLSELVRRYL